MTHTQDQTIPKLRFPEFVENWALRKVSELLDRTSIAINVDPDAAYREIGIRSHGKGVFHKSVTTGKSIGNKRVFKVVPNTLAFNIVFAWEHALAIFTSDDEGFIASHRFPMYSEKPDQSCIQFLKYLFLRPRGKYLLELASPGGAGRNKTLGQKDFTELRLIVPKRDEQRRIAAFLTVVDEKITQLGRKKELLETYKKGCMQQLFSQKFRFKDDEGNDFPDWEEKRLGTILKYEQPTKYLVASSEYSDDYEMPVLTAGKTFILGYTDETNGVFTNLPVIIFDDFTTAFKFVDFSFKAKSSAMKMLTLINDKDNIRFIYAAMLQIRFQVSEHKRYWITEYQREKIPYPHPNEQSKIDDFLSSIDTKIALVADQLEQTKAFKKGLLQQMFV